MICAVATAADIDDDMEVLARQVAEKAGILVQNARINRGHLELLVEGRGWIRSTDLLNTTASE